MSESLAMHKQSTVTVAGRDPLSLVQSLVGALASLTSDRREDVVDAVSVAPFQAEGASIPDLAQRIVDDVLATIVDATTVVAGIELANLLQTDQGWRAWGYVRFGGSPRRQPPAIAVEPSGARPIELRLIVTPAPSGASHGVER